MTSDTSTPRCNACGYELTGLQVEGACPECGTKLWANQPAPNYRSNVAIYNESPALRQTKLWAPWAILVPLLGGFMVIVNAAHAKRQAHTSAQNAELIRKRAHRYFVLGVSSIVIWVMVFGVYALLHATRSLPE